MAAWGHEVTVLTADPTGMLLADESMSGMRIKRVRAFPKAGDYFFAPGIYTEILRGNWDLIHFQGYHTFVAPLGLLAAIQRRIPFVLTFHSGGHSSRARNAVRGLQQRLLTPLIARASALIGVSEFEAALFSERMSLNREKVLVVPNGASLPPPKSETAKTAHRLVISIGRLERYKGHHRAIEALPGLIQRVPDARLKIIGSGPFAGELQALAARLGLEERVTIESIGAAERQRLSDLLASASLVVLLSDYEAHPVAIMEALSLRCRVLVSDTSGLRELSQKGYCRAVPLNAAPEAVAAAMAEELETQRPTADLALPAWDSCAQKLIEIYESVLKKAETNSHMRGGDRLGEPQSKPV